MLLCSLLRCYQTGTSYPVQVRTSFHSLCCKTKATSGAGFRPLPLQHSLFSFSSPVKRSNRKFLSGSFSACKLSDPFR